HLPGTRVHVVDSASTDGTAAVARGAESAELIELERNLGFGAGCNLGLQKAEGRVVALLNPDVELLDDSLLELAHELERAGSPDRLLAPLVLNSDGTRQDNVHPEPGSLADVVTACASPSALPPWAGRAVAPWARRTPSPRRPAIRAR